MLARIHSAATLGLESRVLDVEVDASHGIPRFTIVGLPDATVREARERVRSALRNGGFPLPSGAVTVNLAPADFRKCGAALDLPVAIGLLRLCGVRPASPVRRVFVGELGLDGQVRAVRGALCMALAARDAGFEEIVVPAANAAEAAAVDGIRVIPVEHLTAAVQHVRGETPIAPQAPADAVVPGGGADFADVRGQRIARRAAEIAAAGGHHLLLTGRPEPQTMLARRLPGILPPLRARSRSTSPGSLRRRRRAAGAALVARRPFALRTTALGARAIGGGARIPRDLARAPRRPLLDKLPEFRRDALEAIRQPLQERRVAVCASAAHASSRATSCCWRRRTVPLRFLGDPRRPCSCDAHERRRYGTSCRGCSTGSTSVAIAASRGTTSRRTRERTPRRFATACGRRRGAAAWESPVSQRRPPAQGSCARRARPRGPRLLETAVTRLRPRSGRSPALRMARTIADLGQATVAAAHLSEALSFRDTGIGAGVVPCRRD
jgi:magnesium chelatase family protein